ncbi:MAG: hypothetical protein V2A74_06810 [bacterium]
METKLTFEILPQPDLTTCGPTCLHALYRYYGDDISLKQVIEEAPKLEDGGTLAVLLGIHALKRGYQAKLYTYNLQVFDPTWFTTEKVDLAERLKMQAQYKRDVKLRIATKAYLEFLTGGGQIHFEDLTSGLIRRHLKRSIPILTGLSSTYLYRAMRESPEEMKEDDLRGFPAGHFTVLCGYDSETRAVLIADPFWPNPFAETHQYVVGVDRAICSILLGILTYDANLLIIEPSESA